MTEVKYVVTEAYEWTVPALIDFGKDAGVNEKREVNTTLDKDGTNTPSTGTDGTAPKVIVTKNVISGKFLKITLEPAGGSTDFSVKNDEGVELKYTVTLTDTTIGSDVKTLNRKIGTTGTEKTILTVPALIDFGKDAGVNEKREVNTTLDKDGTNTPSTGTDGTAPKVIVTKNVISGKFLKITLEPAGGSTDFSVKNDEGVELKYTVTLTDTTIGSDVKTLNRKIGTTGTEKTILAVPAGTNTAEAKLKFELSTATTGTSEKAGTYTGNVQFTASIAT